MLATLLYVIGILVLLALAGFVWGALHLRHSIKVADRAVAAVQISAINDLRAECEATFLQAFGEALSIDDLQASARILDARLNQIESIKKAFARPDFYWYFVLPTGAYLGELLRVHAGARWEVCANGGLQMTIRAGDGEATTFPFDKVIKQVTMGGRGDIMAYLLSAQEIDKAIAQVAGEATG